MPDKLIGIVIQARNLVSKNKRGECDSYLVIGLIDENGQFINKPKKEKEKDKEKEAPPKDNLVANTSKDLKHAVVHSKDKKKEKEREKENRTIKSKTVKRSNNPNWKASFEFEDLQYTAFRVEVLDAFSGECLGQKTFNVAEESFTEGWFHLEPRPGKEETVGGDIQVTYEYKRGTCPPLRFNIFHVLISWLEARAMQVEGLFRLSGSERVVRQLYAQFSETSGDPIVAPDEDPHAITGALKLYLREMPVSLIPTDMYDDFLNCMKQPTVETQCKAIQACTAALPEIHLKVLIRLMAFLSRLSKFSDKNKMSASNLGIVFGPTITRNSNVDLAAATREKELAEFLIENYELVFGSDAEAKVLADYQMLKLEEDKKKGPHTFFIFFPGGKKTLEYKPTTELRRTMEKIALASNFDLNSMCIQDEHGDDVSLDATIADVSGSSVTLIQKHDVGDRKKHRKPTMHRLSMQFTDLTQLKFFSDSDKNDGSSKGRGRRSSYPVKPKTGESEEKQLSMEAKLIATKEFKELMAQIERLESENIEFSSKLITARTRLKKTEDFNLDITEKITILERKFSV